MTTLYECDWCQETFRDRGEVALMDVTESDGSGRIHACYDCLPDNIQSQLDIQARAP